MRSLVIQYLANHHRHLIFEVGDFAAGVGWVEIMDELCADLPAGTVIQEIQETADRLQVSATGGAVVPHMLAAAWRRSSAVCRHCGGPRHTSICLP